MEATFAIPAFPTAEELPARLEQTLTALFDDFAEVHTNYLATLDTLRSALGENASPSVADMADAISQQISYTLQFCGSLGLQANWDHFMYPTQPTFLEEDFETFLQESSLRTKRQYVRAQDVLSRFYRQLSPAQKEVYETVIEYISYLETVCPKLAHFRGYMLGDALLKHTVKGYQPDTVLAEQYRKMVEDYLGVEIC